MTGPEGGVKETEPLSGRTVLITGGATGLGLETAKVLSAQGANLIIGTRSDKNFGKAQEQIDRELIPFIVDLTDSSAVSEKLSMLENVPTDLILSAAGGMESFSKEFALRLARAAKAKEIDQKKESLRELDDFVKDEVEKSLDFSDEINFAANDDLLREFRRFPNSRIIFFSSIPSTFSRVKAPPSFYRGVAESKGAFEVMMDQVGRSVSAPEMTIISGGVIEDSTVGKLITKYIVPMLSEEEQVRIAQGYIRNEDMIEATLKVMRGEIPRAGQNPKTIFVTGPGKFVNEIADDDPVFAFNDLDFGKLADRLQ